MYNCGYLHFQITLMNNDIDANNNSQLTEVQVDMGVGNAIFGILADL